MASEEHSQSLPQALDSAVRTGDAGYIAQYLDNGGDVNAVVGQYRVPLLSVAVTSGQKEIVALLLSKGANVDAKDGDGDTALHHACRMFSADIALLLLDAGADVNALDGRRARCLYNACCAAVAQGEDEVRNQEALVRLLLSRGAELDPQEDAWQDMFLQLSSARIAALLMDHWGVDNASLIDGSGQSPLFYTSSPEIVAFLVERGFGINDRDSDGNTALYYACWRQTPDLPLIEALLWHGADVDARCDAGRRPIHVSSSAKVMIELMRWGAVADELDGDPKTGGSARVGKALVAYLGRLLAEGMPLDASPAWLKWLVSAEGLVGEFEKLASACHERRAQWAGWLAKPLHEQLGSSPPLPRAPLTRVEMLQPLKDCAWERRKHLVHFYFETRRRRREGDSVDKQGKIE